MKTRLRPPRISLELQGEIDQYIQKKDQLILAGEDVLRNQKKKTVFQVIQILYHANELTFCKLIDILSSLTATDTKLLFAKGVFDDEASTDSGAAKLIKALFDGWITPLNFKKIVVGELSSDTEGSDKLAEVYKKVSFYKIVNAWQANPYDEIKRNRLDHELWGMVFAGNKNLNDAEKSPLACLVKLFENESLDFVSKLKQLQKICPGYMPELLAELTQRYCDHDDVNQYNNYLQMVCIISFENDEEAKKLSTNFLNCHQTLAKDIVKKYPHVYFKLDSVMQAKVHADLMLEAKSSNELQGVLQKIMHAASKALNAFGYSFDISQNEKQIISDGKEIISNVSEYSTSTSTTSTSSTTTLAPTQFILSENTITTGKLNDVVENDQSEIEVIYQKIKDDLLDVNQQRITSILLRLGSYVNSSDVKPVKRNFFTNLLARDQALTPERIRSCLAELTSDQLAKLFETWGGLGAGENSRAAKYLAELYQAVSGVALTEQDIKNMIYHGELPTEENWLKSQIKKIVLNPLQNTNDLGKKILAAHQTLHDAQAVLQRAKADELAAEEVDYQNRLVQKGFETVFAQGIDALRFDTQGRIFVVTDDAVCSLDIKDDPDLRNSFTQWLANDDDIGREINLRKEFDKIVPALFELPSRSSIIPLQEEMEMHMRLASRVLENAIPKESVLFDWINRSGGWTLIRHKAAIAINQEVRKKFRDALIEAAYEDENKITKMNLSVLNKNLAAARKDLAQFAKQALVKELLKLEINVEKDILNKIDEHAFPHTTATGLQYIRTDVDLQSCERFSATNETAHNKKKWEDGDEHYSFATREIHRNDYIDGQVRQASQTRVELRVPSIAVKKLKSNDAVQDVAKKLEINYARLQEHLGGYDGIMTYNLLTALNFNIMDCTYDHANRQRDSAARILKGTHVFNRKQILAGKPNSLWFVENVSVNQHGINMGYDRWDNATQEATLMCEISMLHNVVARKSCLPPVMRDHVQQVYNYAYSQYNDFLQNNEQGDLYFKATPEGQRVIEQMIKFKEFIKQNTDGLQFNPEAPLQETAMKALLKIMAMDKHIKKSYGPLVQSLSIFIEYASQHGCKSANEREGFISNAVGLLDSAARMNQQQDARLNVVAALGAFLDKSDKDDKHNLKTVRDELNKALNAFNLYGPLASHEDQGASSKIEVSKPAKMDGVDFDFNPASKGKLGFFDWNTNIALPREYTHFDSTHVSGMQAHKCDHIAEFRTALKEINNKEINLENAFQTLRGLSRK